MTTATWRRSGKAEVAIGKVTGDIKLTYTPSMLNRTRPRGLLGARGLTTHATAATAAWLGRARRRGGAPATRARYKLNVNLG